MQRRRKQKDESQFIVGLMSGTSADGIDAVVAEISGGGRGLRAGVVAHVQTPFSPVLRRQILHVCLHGTLAGICELNFVLGEHFARAAIAVIRKANLRSRDITAIGSHGQTIHHLPNAPTPSTLQIGEPAVIAERTGITTVADFRVGDMAAGGQGAPLVPYMDWALFTHSTRPRIVQNIGGIANLTAIPAGASAEKVRAFDTGPGNMVIDAVTDHFFGKPYDCDGRIAASGTVLEHVVNDVLRGPFFLRKPPKTAGREEFGREFVRQFMKCCGRAQKRDVVATATAVTARSIADALRRFVVRGRKEFGEYVVSGGGANNPTLLAMLANELRPLGMKIRASDELGMPSEAKEAAAFALMAFETWNRRPSNVPSATGARRPAILGKVSYA